VGKPTEGRRKQRGRSGTSKVDELDKTEPVNQRIKINQSLAEYLKLKT